MGLYPLDFGIGIWYNMRCFEGEKGSSERQQRQRQRRRKAMQPKFRIIHPNGKGTGSTLEISVSPAMETISGYIMLTLVPQKTVGRIENGSRVLPTFDYEKKMAVKLTLFEVGKMIEVFEGITDSIDDGKGFFHRSPKGNTVITLGHKGDPVPGYWLSIKRKPENGEMQQTGIFLSRSEGYVLAMMFKQALFVMGFGIPEKWTKAGEVKEPVEKAKGV